VACPSDDMKFSNLLPLPKGNRRRPSKARSEIGPTIEVQSEPDPVSATPRPAESTPDLRIGTSTPPVPSPLATRDQESKGMQTVQFQTVYLTTFLSRNADRPSLPDRFRSVFRIGQGDRQKSSDHTVDPNAASVNKSDWKPTAYATTRLAINLVKESADAFPPLKAVAGGLSAILGHCEVCSISPRLCRP